MFEKLIVLGVMLALASMAHAQQVGEEFDPSLIQPIVSNGQEVDRDHDISRTTVKLRGIDGSFCSGTVISHDMVLTAAHCVAKFSSRPESIYVISPHSTFYRTVRAMSVHPEYRVEKIALGLIGIRGVSDLALLLIDGGFEPAIKPALLPQRAVSLNNDKVIIAGYGRTSKYSKDDGTLRASYVQMSDSSWYENMISPSGSSLTCPGDSGGPVFYKTAQGLAVIGVHAWGNCDAGMAYSTSLSKYLPWLQQAIRNLSVYSR